jgi:hypothetical protein
MSNHIKPESSGHPPDQPDPAGASPVSLAFARDEWELLLTLPRRVLIAATSAEADTGRRTVAEGLAGIEAIAAGRASPSRLVREVVAAIYAERDEDAPVAEDFINAPTEIAGVLAECRAAGRTLADRVPAPDAAAYRGWLLAIAGTVCAAAGSGGLFGLGGERLRTAEQGFLDELATALAG